VSGRISVFESRILTSKLVDDIRYEILAKKRLAHPESTLFWMLASNIVYQDPMIALHHLTIEVADPQQYSKVIAARLADVAAAYGEIELHHAYPYFRYGIYDHRTIAADIRQGSQLDLDLVAAIAHGKS
jgi:hypothetical protein